VTIMEPGPKAPVEILPQAAPHRSRFLEGLLQILRGGLNRYNRMVARRSPHGDKVFFDTAEFPWVAEVEAEWRAIRAELDVVTQYPDEVPHFSDVSPDQAHLTSYGKWKTFFFCAYGVREEENCRRCPETMRILKKIPGMKTAFFSILQPDMHIIPHHGPYGGVLRYHLALKVPQPAHLCRIRVDQQIVSWQEGKSLVFDDTYEHEAWNETTGERVVLFVDFERPLPGLLALVNRTIIRIIARSPLVQDAMKSYEEWKKRRRAMAAGGRSSTEGRPFPA
jgi:aspartyl/asparaginyl beta-hydroxylase (cupin superfamily)